MVGIIEGLCEGKLLGIEDGTTVGFEGIRVVGIKDGARLGITVGIDDG